jgi:hypothetical protein
MGVEEGAPVSEGEVVYVATTLVEGDGTVALDRRLQPGTGRLAGNAAAPREGGLDWKNAVAVRERLERRLGRPLDAVLQEGEL